MAVKQIRNPGKKVWMARVAYRGRRRASFCESKETARQAEADLLKQLKAEAGQVDAEGQRPATLRRLFEFYAEDLEARGKGEESIGRVEYTARAIERLPEILDRPLSEIGDAEVFAFRNRRAREGTVVYELVAGVKREKHVPTKPSTINRDLRTLRAAMKKARVSFPWRGVFQGRRDARTVAPSRGRAARARADAVALPRDLQARGAHADAAFRDPDASPRVRPPGAGRDSAPPGEGGRAAGHPERRRPEDRARAAGGDLGQRVGVPEAGRQTPTASKSGGCSVARRALLGSRTSTSTTSVTTAPPWRSTRASRRRS
jgi:hypothetical protein